MDYVNPVPRTPGMEKGNMKTLKIREGVAAMLLLAMVSVGCRQGSRQASGNAASQEKASRRSSKAQQPAEAPDTSKPVAEYSANLNDDVTNNDFIVKLYPTLEQTVFQARIRYGGNEVSQDITMIPKEYYRRIILEKGDEDGTCVLGFEDPDGKFNEMKLITGSGTQIGIQTIKAYYLSNQ